jgi:predicted ATP-dependent serine protease
MNVQFNAGESSAGEMSDSSDAEIATSDFSFNQFVGRGPLVEQVVPQLACVSRGEGSRTVLVSGDDGIGKSSFLKEVRCQHCHSVAIFQHTCKSCFHYFLLSCVAKRLCWKFDTQPCHVWHQIDANR